MPNADFPKIQITYDRPSARPTGGWFKAPEPFSGSRTKVVASNIERVLQYQVGEDEVALDGVSYRTVRADWLNGRDDIVARAELKLLGCANRRLSNEDLFEVLDTSSQESSDFGDLLTSTYQGRVASLFKHAKHLGNFIELEVRQDLCGCGLGIALGTEFLKLLERRYDVGLIFMKPFPLQYEGALPPPSAKEFDAAVDCAFRSGRFRLALKYARHWGAIKLPGSAEHMLILGHQFDDTTLVSTKTWWRVQ